jgi:hypothetical protein
MTPQEKAKELANKFLRTYKVSLYPPFTKASDEAKQCALIAVDEIIKNMPHSFYSGIRPAYKGTDLEYWQEVKQEIENL